MSVRTITVMHYVCMTARLCNRVTTTCIADVLFFSAVAELLVASFANARVFVSIFIIVLVFVK